MNNLEIEYKIISAVFLLGGEERQSIFTRAVEGQFSDETAKSIFIKFKRLFQKYPNANGDAYITVLDQHEKKAVIIAAEKSMSSQLAAKELEDSLRLFRDMSDYRKYKSELEEAVLSEDIGLPKMRGIIDRAEQAQTGNIRKSSADIYLDEYEKPLECVPTGFHSLDEILNGGFIKGTLATIGARPSTGKTAFAINIAAQNPDIKILFFSLEMSSRMIYDRLIAERTDIDYSLTGHHIVNLNTVRAVLGKYQNLQIIDDMPNIEDIENLIYTLKPDLVIIDFIQIVGAAGKFTDNRQRIDYISQKLKLTAKRVNCCILTLSQLTRGAADKPTMSALKESGGLEQDCDYVILLHRDYVNDKSNENLSPEKTTLTLDKNKFGHTKELEFNFDGRHQRFTEKKIEGAAHINPKEAMDDELPEDLPF